MGTKENIPGYSERPPHSKLEPVHQKIALESLAQREVVLHPGTWLMIGQVSDS